VDLTDQQLDRYARHIILREVGGAGQKRLLNARVLVVGAGGLGSPVIMYLAAAGVGTIGVIDDDHVSLSNLQRQIVHTSDQVGEPKTASAARTVKALNPDVHVVEHAMRITAANVMEVISDYDIVADGSDNFDTRFLLNDACYLAGKTLVSAAILQFDGQLSTYKAHLRQKDAADQHPCYRCIFPAPPPPDVAPSCAEAGVLGMIAGTMGSLQATEVVKELLDVGESMSGRLLIYDALAASFRTVRAKPDPACALCGTQATIRDLSRHAA
jgi:adenylyltransferase/sulfurtransferase